MWAEDIVGSEAYARALQKTGIITETETKEILEGLEKVRKEWAAGEFVVVVSLCNTCNSDIYSTINIALHQCR